MSSPIILAIETATNACSVAIGAKSGEGINACERLEIGSNIHSKRLLTMVEEVLEESSYNAKDLGVVAVGQGPGSFTGLRIGVGVAQGIAYGAGCPMIGISSLEALAFSNSEDGHILAGIDARMGEVYWCEYFKQGQYIKELSNIQVTPPSDINATAGNAVLVGNAWQEYQAEIPSALLSKAVANPDVIYPHAASVLQLAFQKHSKGEVVTASEFAPVYVRNDVAKKSSKRPY